MSDVRLPAQRQQVHAGQLLNHSNALVRAQRDRARGRLELALVITYLHRDPARPGFW